MSEIVNAHEAICPVNHAHRIVFGECAGCGEVVIACLDGCPELAVWQRLFPDEPEKWTPSGHELRSWTRL